MSVAALIPAAGLGTRLGLGPKAFVEVGGRTLLERAVEALSPHVDEVIVALPPETPEPHLAARFMVGGETRQETVHRLVQATDAQFVLVHDAARPFLPPEVIRRVLAAARDVGAATAALPLADTLVKGRGDVWDVVLPRENVWAVQTPQGFLRQLLLAAHGRARAAGHAATDDAGLIAREGGAVRLVQGDARLFKVTTPGDLMLARAFAAVWDSAGWDSTARDGETVED